MEFRSKTFINTVIQYKPSTDVAATKDGKELGPAAFHAFTEDFWLPQENTSVSQKYPHKYENGLSGWESESGFPVSSDGCMDEGQPYCYKLLQDLKKHIFTLGQKPKLIISYW